MVGHLLEAATDDTLQLGVDRALGAHHGGRRARRGVAVDLDERRAGEGDFPREQLVEDDAQRPDVGPSVHVSGRGHLPL